MILTIPKVFPRPQVAALRARLDAAEWTDGRVTAGHQSAQTKNNSQIPENHPVALAVGELILGALAANNLFRSAALPLKVFPPLFNRYAGGQTFGTHVDNSLRTHGPTGGRIRTDLSCTLFFSDPEEYDGGELVIEDTYGSKSVKLPAGDMILYPATSLHHVTPVTRGQRVSSFFWLQSTIRQDAHRTLLFDLDTAIQRIAADPGPAVQQSTIQLTGVYHNLIRQWAEL